MNGYSHRYYYHHNYEHRSSSSNVPWWKNNKSQGSNLLLPDVHRTTQQPNAQSTSNHRKQTHPIPTSITVTNMYQTSIGPLFNKPWSYVDRVGDQFVMINAYDNLPLPAKPPTDLSHFSHSPPNLTRYNANRRYQFKEGLPKGIEKLQAFLFNEEKASWANKWKRFRHS